MLELNEIHTTYNTKLFESDMSEEDIGKELEIDDVYKKNFINAKLQMGKFLTSGSETNIQVPSGTTMNSQQTTHTFSQNKALPKLQIPKFEGSVKEWLPFWSQFKKYHEDPTLSNEVKFQYLLQATVEKSAAHNIVTSFPPTSENYNKAIKSLKNRFGRDDLVSQFYIRELLTLVLQNATSKKPNDLTELYDKLGSYLRALNSLGVMTKDYATLLYPLVESSLPEEVLRLWKQCSRRDSINDTTPPESHERLTKLMAFLELEVYDQEQIKMAMSGFNVVEEQTKKKHFRGIQPRETKTESIATASALLVSKSNVKLACIFCNSEHENDKCTVAHKLDFDDRKNTVKRERCCFRCLKRGHTSKMCKVRLNCNWCGGRHVLLMCEKVNKQDKNISSPKTECNSQKSLKECNLTTFSGCPDVCLQTTRVILYSDTKEKIVRVLFDSGSQRSYILSSVAEELGYVSHGTQDVIHSLFGGHKSEKEQHQLFLIRMRDLDQSFACKFLAFEQDVICESIPQLKSGPWIKELRDKGIHLNDLDGDSAPIEVLIGADVYGKLFSGRKVELRDGLTAFDTVFGWTLTGKLSLKMPHSDSAILLNAMFIDTASPVDLWRLDLIGITDPIEVVNKITIDKRTRDFLIDTAKFNSRYEVKLPWVENHAQLPSNYDIAYKRLIKNVQKTKSQNIYDEYDKVFDNWLNEGIIEKVQIFSNDEKCHYLPHRPVLKPKSTTPIRPVFDASASSAGYPSLNDCLEKGPNLIELVPAVLNRFREGAIGVVADIKKAFLQIEINEQDRDYLRFLWVKDNNLVIYRHRRVVFGLSCSPFILAAIIQLHLDKCLNNDTETIKCRNFSAWSTDVINKLKGSFYVDNCITSVNTFDELSTLISTSKEIFYAGGFDLRGWENTRDSSVEKITNVLGLRWDKEKDVILINPTFLDFSTSNSITKRLILSTTHRIFDPIGVTCPVSLQPKLLIKKLWDEKAEWDSEVSETEKREFLEWISELPVLQQIEIPRDIGRGRLTLHVFGDASGQAYSAVVFARVENNGCVSVNLLNAKSRVAPKKSSIPRLELMAATIAARLATSVCESLTRPVEDIHYWTDSTTVLAWIKRDLQWGTFVYNRVTEIRALSNKDAWQHVPGEKNPADLPSRGCSPSRLVNSAWWLGPSWLYETEEGWPSIEVHTDELEVRNELKKSSIICLSSFQENNFDFVAKFSSYTQIIRFSAWIHRFMMNCQYKKSTSGHISDVESLNNLKALSLTLKEIQEAEIRLFKHLQKVMYSGSNREKFASLKIFENSHGLRVLKTKILHRDDDPLFLCPIVLDSDNEIVYLLIRETHEKLGHAGTTLVMSHLREKFWIISLRKKIKAVITDCVVCKRQTVKSATCEEPALPPNRVRDAAVFEIVGVDFAGPVFLRSGEKAWISLFTCAIYRAVHLELASGLSVEAFVECLRRFIARRGRPKVIYSDNGSNFVGTNNAFNDLDWVKIKKFCTTEQIDWIFNPPSAPWWGGWWERLVGVMKTMLRKVLGKACLSYECMTTVLCDAEAIINDRPLTYVSENPDDLKPLTPSMFILERKDVSVPDCDMMYNTKFNKKLKYRQKICEDLRARFRSEYLGTLVIKNKKENPCEIKCGDIVLVGDDIFKRRLDWPLARVIDIIPGRDGETRVFILKNKTGIIKRPIQRIYPLEISQSTTDITTVFREKAAKSVKPVEKTSGKVNKEQVSKSDTVEEQSIKNEKVYTRSGRSITLPERYTV